jgi:hypothetical protein
MLLPSTREAERAEPECEVSLDLIARPQIIINVQTKVDNSELLMGPVHTQASMEARKASPDPRPDTE